MDDRKRDILVSGAQSEFWKIIENFARDRMASLQQSLLNLDPGDPGFPLDYARLQGEIAGMQRVVNYPKSTT